MSNITSCVGDTITINCNIESSSHGWNFGPLSEVFVTAGTSQDVVRMGFTYRLLEIGDAGVLSAVTGTVIPEINNTMIVCKDSNLPAGQGETQEGIVSVLGECLIQ